MQTTRWTLPVLLLASLPGELFSEPTGPIQTERFNADQLAALHRERIIPVDESETTLALGGDPAPASLTLICFAGTEVDHAYNLLEGKLVLKREQGVQYRDSLGGLWTATVDASKGTISLRPKPARGYRFAVNAERNGLEIRELVELKVVQRVLTAARARKHLVRDLGASHDDLPATAARTADELTATPRP